MKRRTASDIMAECIIDLVNEYKQTITHLNGRIEVMKDNINYWEDKTKKAVEDCDKATDKLGEIAEIIAGITDHTTTGNVRIYLSDINSEDSIQLRKLFSLLDIPMTADQVKDGDTIE